MAATVVIQELNGTGPTFSTITSGRYCTSDAFAPGNNNPCVVPSSGYNYSYWKHHTLSISGTFTSISNIRWYTSGAVKTQWQLGSGGALLVGTRTSGDSGCPTSNYNKAGGVEGTSGYYMGDATNGHSYYRGSGGAIGDADAFVSATPLTIDTTTYTAAASTKCVVTQIKIDTDAVQGDKASQTLTWRYDEI